MEKKGNNVFGNVKAFLNKEHNMKAWAIIGIAIVLIIQFVTIITVKSKTDDSEVLLKGYQTGEIEIGDENLKNIKSNIEDEISDIKGNNFMFVTHFASDGVESDDVTLHNTKGETVKMNSLGSYFYVRNSNGDKVSFVGTEDGNLVQEDRRWLTNMEVFENVVKSDKTQFMKIPFMSTSDSAYCVAKVKGKEAITEIFEDTLWTIETAEDYGITDDTWLKLYFTYNIDSNIFTDVTCCINDESEFGYGSDLMLWQINTILGYNDWELGEEWYDLDNMTNDKALNTQMYVLEGLSAFINGELTEEKQLTGSELNEGAANNEEATSEETTTEAASEATTSEEDSEEKLEVNLETLETEANVETEAGN